jgi:hypothetical protein
MKTLYSFVMPYYRRLGQFRNTLASFYYHYGKREDFELIVVEDAKSGDSDALLSLLGEYQDLHITHDKRENQFNPAPLFNAGARLAIGKYLVITNPECMHPENILKVFDEAAAPGHYIVVACMNTSQATFIPDGTMHFKTGKWLHHSVHHNTRYHYCSAIATEDYWRIGGFDERFADGLAAEDDEFRDRVSKSLRIVCRDDVMVLHQEHSRPKNELPPEEYNRLLSHNRAIYRSGL